MCINPPASRQSGISLIELIMFIVIVGIALAGITLVMQQTTGHSADTMLRKQALTVAESLLEEIEAHPFSGGTGSVNQTNRLNPHSIFDYNNYAASGVLDMAGSAVPGLSNYDVAVTMASGVGSDNIPPASAVRITVTVTDPVGKTIDVTGYRTAY
jgi:MSHA pilin protein MshD